MNFYNLKTISFPMQQLRTKMCIYLDFDQGYLAFDQGY